MGIVVVGQDQDRVISKGEKLRKERSLEDMAGGRLDSNSGASPPSWNVLVLSPMVK